MITIEVGVDRAMAGVCPEGDGPVTYEMLPEGEQHICSLSLPEVYDFPDAFLGIMDALTRHIAPGAGPCWIECSDPMLHSHLLQKYHLDPHTQNVRPVNWGQQQAVGA